MDSPPANTLTLRDFSGEEYYKFCRQEYDRARTYLKSCGKPKDQYDSAQIEIHKGTCSLFQRYAKGP